MTENRIVLFNLVNAYFARKMGKILTWTIAARRSTSFSILFLQALQDARLDFEYSALNGKSSDMLNFFALSQHFVQSFRGVYQKICVILGTFLTFTLFCYYFAGIFLRQTERFSTNSLNLLLHLENDETVKFVWGMTAKTVLL